jgi:hypothetical protein
MSQRPLNGSDLAEAEEFGRVVATLSDRSTVGVDGAFSVVESASSQPARMARLRIQGRVRRILTSG